MNGLPDSDPEEPVGFTSEVLDRSDLAIPLLRDMAADQRNGC